MSTQSPEPNISPIAVGTFNTIVVILYLIAMLIPIYFIILHVFLKSCTVSTSKEQTPAGRRIAPITKIILFTSIFSSFLYIFIQSMSQLFVFIPVSRNTYYCHYTYIGPTILYTFERFLTTNFFLFTAYDTFKNTQNGYNKRNLISVVIFGIVIVICILIPMNYIQSKWEYRIVSYHGLGTTCLPLISDNDNTVIYLLFFTGTFLEIIFNVLAAYLLLSQLFKVILDVHTLQSISDSKTTNVADFHDKTVRHNGLVLLMCKLVIIFVVVIIGSVFGVIISKIPNLLVVGWCTAIVIHIYCLYFTFAFSKDHFTKYFCGNQCILFCFPYIKTIALTRNNTGKQCVCYCCFSSDAKREQKQIFNLAKAEIGLILL
eukprot:366613_1